MATIIQETNHHLPMQFLLIVKTKKTTSLHQRRNHQIQKNLILLSIMNLRIFLRQKEKYHQQVLPLLSIMKKEILKLFQMNPIKKKKPALLPLLLIVNTDR